MIIGIQTQINMFNKKKLRNFFLASLIFISFLTMVPTYNAIKRTADIYSKNLQQMLKTSKQKNLSGEL